MAVPYSNLSDVKPLLGTIITNYGTSLKLIGSVGISNRAMVWGFEPTRLRWYEYTRAYFGLPDIENVVYTQSLPELIVYDGNIWKFVENPSLEGDRGDLYLPQYDIPKRSVMVGVNYLASFYPTLADVGPSGILSIVGEFPDRPRPRYDPDAWTVTRHVYERQYDLFQVGDLPDLVFGFMGIMGALILGDVTMFAAVGIASNMLGLGQGGTKVDEN